jgi:hypothetical protein
MAAATASDPLATQKNNPCLEGPMGTAKQHSNQNLNPSKPDEVQIYLNFLLNH